MDVSHPADNEALQGRVVLITGGARRIGAAIAETLHRRGADLIIHHHQSGAAASELKAHLEAIRECSVQLVTGDLRDMHTIRTSIREAIAQSGGLYALINNASAFFPTPLASATEDDWSQLMDVNLKAPFFLSQVAAPSLQRQEGAIINITDIYADRPLADHAAYCAGKAGLVSLTRSLAQSLAPGVRVNAISPGAIIWPEENGEPVAQQRILSRIPLNRIGNSTDIASLVLYLLTAGHYITGQVINVDGGRSANP